MLQAQLRQRYKRAAIPQPNENLASLAKTAIATKEVVEGLAGQRGDVVNRAVTFQDLLDLGLIQPSELPRD